MKTTGPKTIGRALGIGLIALMSFTPGLASAAPAHTERAVHGERHDGDGRHEFRRDGRDHDRVVVTTPFWNSYPVYIDPAPYDTPAPAYWYYCPSANAYYPYVATCPVPWVPVTPSAG